MIPQTHRQWCCKDLTVSEIPQAWSALDILNHQGLVSLNDIAERMRFQPEAITEKARKLQNAGCPMWESLGIRKVWNLWVVNMSLFKSFYLRYFFPYQRIHEHWNHQRIFMENGVFLLDHVCAALPPQKVTMILKASIHPESGISEDHQMKCKVIDMKRFRNWFQQAKQED